MDLKIYITSIIYIGFIFESLIEYLQINLSATPLIKKQNQYPYLNYQFERYPLPTKSITTWAYILISFGYFFYVPKYHIHQQNKYEYFQSPSYKPLW